MDDQSKEGKKRLNIANMASGVFIYTFIWMQRMTDDWSFLFAAGELICGSFIVTAAILLIQSAANHFCDIEYRTISKMDTVKIVGGAFAAALFIAGAIYR